MSGVPPLPTSLKILRGNPGCRKLNDAEPQPIKGIPECPDFLDDEAKREWARVTMELEAMGLLYKIDRALLAGYVQAWSEFKESMNWLAEHDWFVTSEGGGLYVHPMMGIKNKSVERILKISQQFGFSPASRTRIRMEERSERDEFGEFMKHG